MAFAERHRCRAAESLSHMLSEDLDGVLVATPHDVRLELITAAAELGHHVMVEKPLALTVAEARAAVQSTEKAGVILQVAHFRRRLAATRMLKQTISDLGEIHAAEGWFTRIWGVQGERPWRDDPGQSPLGGMTALGIHLIDNFHYLLGPISRVSCLSKQIGALTGIDDITMAIVEFAAGPIGHLGTSLRVPFRSTTGVMGSAGSAWSVDDGNRFLIQTATDRQPGEVPVAPVDAVRENLEAFCDSIRTGRAPETGGREGLAVVTVMEAMALSAASGGSVVEVEGLGV